ncbi:hypothetical protein D7W79_13455 [Corallococcus exercitus]|nr:hypothetical protein D7W79_13455 [Corallococcus exercitus]
MDPTPGPSSGSRFAMVDLGNQVVRLPYRVIDGAAVFDGDILLPVKPGAEGADGEARQGLATVARTSLWPDGIIPYVIASGIPNPGRITTAINEWNSRTRIKLVPRGPNEGSWVTFRRAPVGVCNANIGRNGGEQFVNVGDVSSEDDTCNAGGVIHEIGHSVGLFHMQSRADRDAYVNIYWDNIQPDAVDQFTTYVAQGRPGMDWGPYDLGSIMHYGSCAATLYPLCNETTSSGRTMLRKNGTGIVANRTGLSGADIASVNQLYADTHPPTVAITTPAAGELRQGAFIITTWSADDTGVTQVAYSINNVPLTVASQAPFSAYWDTRTMADGPALIQAVAGDAYGYSSQPATVQVTVDNHAPSPYVNDPSQGQVVSGDVRFSGGAEDLTLTGLRLLVDGTQVGSADSGGNSWATQQVTWNSWQVADGLHTFSVVADDRAGHTGRADVVAHVDNQPPTVRIDAPAADALVGGTVRISATASDTSLSLVEVRAGGQLVGSASSSGGTLPVAVDWNSQSVPDGPRTLTVRAFDRGAHTATVTRQVFVDNQPPEVRFDSPAAGAFVTGIASFTITASDLNLTSIALLVDGISRANAGVSGTSATRTLSWNSLSVPDGPHTFTAEARDVMGHVSRTPLVLNVYNKPPTVTLTGPYSPQSQVGVIVMTASASSAVMPLTVRFYVNGALICTDTAAPYECAWNSGTADGSIPVKVTATDVLNRTSETPRQSLNINNLPPVILWDAPAANATVGAFVSLQTVSPQAPDFITQFEVVDNVRNVDFYMRQGTTTTLLGSTTKYPWSLNWAVPASLPDGSTFELYAVATDDRNQTGTTRMRTVTLQRGGASILVTEPNVDGLYFHNEDVLVATAEVSGSTDVQQVDFELRIPGEATGIPMGTVQAPPYTVEQELWGLLGGDWELVARATLGSGATVESVRTIVIQRR